MKYKMLFSDYDGTFQKLEWGEDIPQIMLDAVKDYRKAGGKFVLCSGRPLYTQNLLAKKYGLVCDANIASQGSVIAVNGEVIKKSGLSIDCHTKIRKILDAHGREYSCFVNGDLYYYGTSEIMQGYLGYYKGNKYFVEDFSKNPVTSGEVYEKLLVMKTTDEDLSDIVDEINGVCGDAVEMNSGAPMILEIVDKSCTKYEACKVIAKYFGIDEGDCVSMGDSTNDLTLVKFGLGIGVEGGHPDLLSAVDYIAPPIEDFPVKQVIDKIITGEDIAKIYKKR